MRLRGSLSVFHFSIANVWSWEGRQAVTGDVKLIIPAAAWP